MKTDTVYIKNMVCPRCIDAVSEIYKDLNLSIKHIQLGKVVSHSTITDSLKKQLSIRLKEKGFELLQDEKHQTIAQIKTLIVTQIHQSSENLAINFSEFLAAKTGQDYSSLSRLFSTVEGITIEKFILKQKIERIKELLFYKEFSLSEIAFQMGYSSVAHLSAQFKKETGMPPSVFKKLKDPNHKSLDSF